MTARATGPAAGCGTPDARLVDDDPLMPDLPPDDTRHLPGDTAEGGDPVCWLDRVCPECGRLADEAAMRCERCGAALPGD